MIRKRILCLALLCCLLFSACAKRDDAEEHLDFQASAPVPQAGQTAAPQGGGQNTEASSKLELSGSVCHAFPGMLYGAVAYTNTGDSVITLTEATFTFTYAGGSRESTFVPATAAYEAVQPGETAYCTLWLPLEQTEPVRDIALQAQLFASPAHIREQTLTVSKARLIQNYPGFATLSGKLENPGRDTTDLNMIYVGFYDAQGAFLGAWHFTRNTVLQPGDGAAFEVHLQSLPIEGLSERTADMRFRAFGM